MVRWPMALFALSCAALGNVGAVAQAADRTYSPENILSKLPIDSVVSGRVLCAAGIRGDTIASLQRAFGKNAPPGAADECLSYLLRLARQGTLGPPSTMKQNRAPAALALDSAFMTAFGKAERIKTGVPTLAALRPIAERCFRSGEPDVRLCSAAGYALGSRFVHGESPLD